MPFDDAATLAPQRVTLADGKTIDLKLPAGVETGTQMRLAGKGEPGPGGAGDAIVTIEVQPHRFFTRDGDDVRLDLPVQLDEAVLGGKVSVPTVDGRGDADRPQGLDARARCCGSGKGFHRKDRRARRPARHADGRSAVGDDAELSGSCESWASDRARNPRGGWASRRA